LIDPLVKVIQDPADSEAVFRGLVALGTALSIRNEEIANAAIHVFGVKEALQNVNKTLGSENRVKEVVAEIEELLA
jgi:phospholipase A-2-activating protein